MTVAELHAARAFREGQRFTLSVKNDNEPPDVTVSVYAGNIRHDCAARGGASVFLEMREHYVPSPCFLACDCGEVCCQAPAHQSRVVECDNCGPVPLVPAGLFAFIWTRGRCAACGLTARSGSGRLVDTRLRPPARRAVLAAGADIAGRER